MIVALGVSVARGAEAWRGMLVVRAGEAQAKLRIKQRNIASHIRQRYSGRPAGELLAKWRMAREMAVVGGSVRCAA